MKWLCMIFAALLSVGFSACSESDNEEFKEETETNALIATLKQYKWTHRSVSDWNDTSYGGHWDTGTHILYFMDNNVGYAYQQTTDHDTSMGSNRDTWFDKFTYTVSDNTVTIRYASTGNSVTFTYSGGYLVWSDSYYEPVQMTQSDISFVTEKAENLEYEQNIYRYVEVTDRFDEENLTVDITVRTQLPEKYPTENFRYGVEYGYDYYGSSAYFTVYGNTGTVSILLDMVAIHMRTYRILQEKVANGQKLSSDEKNLLDDCIDLIKEDLRKFQARVFVEANGIKYYVEDDIYAGTIDFDPKYEPDEEEEEGGAGNDDYYTGIVNGHKYVDLGLSVKWATCNVGASSPEEYGDYFAWGETTTKSSYDEDNSTTYGLSTSELKSRGIIGSDGNLTAAYDAATANWGSKWRMPTRDEIKELNEECTWTWTTQSGVEGCKVTGPNGKSIFLPAAGYRYGTYLGYAGSYGYCWSATPGSYSSSAYYLSFRSDYYDWYNNFRDFGRSVRPVSE